MTKCKCSDCKHNRGNGQVTKDCARCVSYSHWEKREDMTDSGMTRRHILETAINTVCVDREMQYGSPENSFAEIAKLWAAYLDREISAHDVPVMMNLFKVARIKTGQAKSDNYVDAAGYIACAAEIKQKMILEESK